MIVLKRKHIELCSEEGISLAALVKLMAIDQQLPWREEIAITNDEFFVKDVITEKGKAILKKLEKHDDDAFARWWAAYPATATHAHFIGNNALKLSRPECKRLFKKIVNSGIEAEDLIRVLKEEVRQRKLSSSGTDNRLNFMPNSINYLEKGYYLAQLEQTEEDDGDVSTASTSKLRY